MLRILFFSINVLCGLFYPYFRKYRKLFLFVSQYQFSETIFLLNAFFSCFYPCIF